MPFNIGPLQLVLILLILLVVFGAKRLPEIGRSLGSSAREFKDGITGESKPDESASADDEDSSVAHDAGEKVGSTVRELADGVQDGMHQDSDESREKKKTKT